MSRSPFPSAADEARADHQRDLRKHDLRLGDRLDAEHLAAVAQLVGICETIAASGRLTALVESQLRIRIAAALTAFQMPSQAEREPV